MADEQEGQMISIYVMPTEEGKPPRAILYSMPVETIEDARALSTVEGALATWSRDMGVWQMPDGTIVPEDIGNAITEHAKNLGVEW